MTPKPYQSENLEADVNLLLRLLDKEPSLRGKHDTAIIKTSRDKVIAPRFEIVFAGTYSAGKSMLINALLGQELLYSNTGHATGIECCIEYARSLEEERVQLTFLSVQELQEAVDKRCKTLQLKTVEITEDGTIENLRKQCKKITEEQKGSGKIEREDEADGLLALLDGFDANRKYIDSYENSTYEMDELGLSKKDAHNYARRGTNSAVLKRIKYYCHHPLLADGNVLIDLPGIDAPILRDAELTYRKVEDTNTSAVICVMKADQEGEIETAEKKLIEAIRENSGIRDRVFYVFNRIDKTWRDPKLKQELDALIGENFSHTRRGIYETSALLGFWASQLKNTNEDNRWGLDTIFKAEIIQDSEDVEGTPSFVLEFLDYCYSDKLPAEKFPDIVRRKTQTKNDQYLEIINRYKTLIIEQLLEDSGIEEFSNAITQYLTEEKRPELFANLASDISEPCNDLREFYLEERRKWDKKPSNIAEITEKDLAEIEKDIWNIGNSFYQEVVEEIQLLVMNTCEEFQQDFNKLHQKMQQNLTELVENFSILDTFANTCRNHRHVTAPLIAVLGQAFYDIADGLENVLIEESEILIANFFQRVIKRVRKQRYYRQLCNLLLGDDCGIVQSLQDIQIKIIEGIKVLASAECVFYVIESPDLYDYEDSVWLYQFRETLQEASNSKDVKRMVEAEESIRQLLEIDFKAKFKQTIEVNFGSKIINMLNKELLAMAEEKRQLIWQQSDRARMNKRTAIEKEAQAKIDERNHKLNQVELKIAEYNQAVKGLNSYLEIMNLDEYKLLTIQEDNFSKIPSTAKFNNQNDFHDVQTYIEEELMVSDDNSKDVLIPNPLIRPSYPTDQSEGYKKLNRGQLVVAKITGFESYGVFVEVGGIKGLLHIKNISQDRVESLESLFEIGQSIKALIDKIDEVKGEVSLSTKFLENYKGEILKDMAKVMATAEERIPQARQKLLKS